MAIRLKYATASQEIPLGIFVDDTDGKTAETGLTIANTDIKLWKNGATAVANKNSGGATHDAGGIYYAVLDATDTDTLGPLVVFCHVAGALPVRVECDVVAADAWAVEFGAAGAKNLGVVAYGTAHSVAATWLRLGAEWTFGSNALAGAVLLITGGTTGVGQSRVITASSDVVTLTVDAFDPTLTGTITYVVLAAPPASATSIPDVNVASITTGAITAAAIAVDAIDADAITAAAGAEIAAAVWDVATSGHTTSGSFGEQVKTDIDAILADTGTDGVVLAADSITAAKIADDAFSSEHFADGAITAATFAANAIDATALSDDAVDAILDEVVEGSTTMRQMLRGFASALLGKVSGAATTTVTFRDVGDTKNRIVATVDSSGNRSAVTLTLT